MKYIIIITLFIFTQYTEVNAAKDNNKMLEIADTYYKNGEYVKALKYYQKALKKNKFPTESYENMANAYLKTGDVKNAHRYFLIAERRKNVHQEIEITHAFALKRVGKYSGAKALLKHYLKTTNDSSVVKYIEDCDLALKWKKPNPKIKVANLKGLNSYYSDMSPYYYNGKLIFSSSREEILILDKSGSTGEPYYRLYVADIDGLNATNVGQYHNHEKRNHNITSLTFGDDENEVFYSTNQKIKKDSAHNISPLKIYHSKNENGKWKEGKIIIATENDHINYAHPFYDKNTKMLFFTSNREGGFGGMDVYYVKREGNTWSVPINAGEGVNADGDELFPSFYGNELYFSSDRRAGLGGLDIFSSTFLNQTFQTSENMKMPINTNYDDFGVTFIDSNFTLGYFTSNRKGTKGSDDIFAFRVEEKEAKIVYLSGVAIDALTGNELTNTLITLTDDDGVELGSVETDNNGQYFLELIADKKYNILAENDNYFSVNKTLTTSDNKNEYELDLVAHRKGDVKLIGKVVDDETIETIKGVKVTIISNDKTPILNETKANGTFENELKEEKIDQKINLSIKLEKDGYISNVISVNEKANEKGIIEVNCNLHKLNIGVDIGKVADVQPIYFDVDKAEIRPEAALELDKIVIAMQENPKIIIELGSHTDARGDDAYNLDLSERRAKASANYLIAKGINKSRVKFKGYGETQLVNNCTNDVECTDEQHQENRRTEFKIIKF